MDSSDKFLLASNSGGFLDGIPLRVEVTDADRLDERSDVTYRVNLWHGKFYWTFRLRAIDIMHLRLILRFTKMSHTRDAHHVSEFGILNLMIKEEKNASFLKDLFNRFLNFVSSDETVRNHPAVLNLFEVSRFSFLPGLGEKGREVFAEKRSASCICKNALWVKRWFILKQSFLFYLDDKKQNIEGVFLLDNKTVALQRDERISIRNASHKIFIKFPNSYHCSSWATEILGNIQKIRDEFDHSSERTRSFSPVRLAPCHWFVDGSDYFSAVADALEAAKHEIFISAWFLAPHVYMKRVPYMEEKWMLKSILKRKADASVKIHVLLYNAPDGFLKMGDKFVKSTLENLNQQNIQVLRHRGKVLGKSILWSHHEKLVIVDQNVAFVSGIDLTYGRWDYPEHPLEDIGYPMTDNESFSNGNGNDRQLWPGSDYTNDYISMQTDFTNPFEDHIDRQTVPRTPWHDIACVTYEDAARDVARHFIQMWNFAKATEKRNQKDVTFLIPKTYLLDHNEIQIHPYAVNTFVQVLRSSALWSVGIRETEMSIAEAYCAAIDEAEHYVYIENQFFISQNARDDIINLITFSLTQRILRASEEEEKFRVFIVLPLIPMFEGDFSKADKSQQIQAFAHYQYHSISRGEHSLIGSLLNTMSQEEIDEYVCFCSLRNHGELNGKPITEVLYVHSKMMIVDDVVAIIGSANINDRSLVGDRDSEVCLRIEDTEMIESVMGGRSYNVGKFAFNLRQRIFAEHLGLLQDFNDSVEILQDIVSDDFYHGVWKRTAKRNTKIYRQVFRAVPSDEVRRFSDVEAYQNKTTSVENKKEKLEQLKGFLVEFPTQYLADEDLICGMPAIVPDEVFT